MTSLTFVGYGSVYQEIQARIWLEPFERATGIKVRQAIHRWGHEFDDLRAMVDEGNVHWDVVIVGGSFGLERETPWLEPIDYGVVPGSDIMPGFASKYRVPDMVYSVCSSTTARQLPGSSHRGWADMFDLERIPGRRGFHRSADLRPARDRPACRWVAPNDLYPLDIGRALNRLETIRHAIEWWDSDYQAQQFVSEGRVSLCAAWNREAQQASGEGHPIGIQWDRHLLMAEYIVVPRGNRNRRAAMGSRSPTSCRRRLSDD